MKRLHGEGSIYRRSNGSYQARVSTIDEDGTHKRLSFTSRDLEACKAWIKRTTGQVERGLTFEGASTQLGAFLDEWLKIKGSRLRPATFEQYRRLTRLYIRPGLGLAFVKDLNVRRIQAFYSQLQEEDVGRRTIEIVHSILHGCLKYAQRQGLVTQNSASLVEVPRPEKREMQVWTEDQVSQFIAGAPDQTFYRLVFATGMRRGEILALQWKDLDWLTGVLRIRRQVFEPEGGGWVFQPPKTDRGRRKVKLGQDLLEALRVHFNQDQPLARAIAGDRWQEYDLIFPSSIGTPRNGYTVSKEFKRVATSTGLHPIRFHDIRHTVASLLLMHGLPPVEVAGMLGMSLAVLLDTYAHWIPDNQGQAAAIMAEITTPVEFPGSGLAQESGQEHEDAKLIDPAEE